MLVIISIIAAWSFIKFIVCENSAFIILNYDDFMPSRIPKRKFKQNVIYLILAIASAGVFVLSNYLFINFLS